MSIGISYSEPEEIDKTDDYLNYPSVRCQYCHKIYQLDYYPSKNDENRKRFDNQKCIYCKK